MHQSDEDSDPPLFPAELELWNIWVSLVISLKKFKNRIADPCDQHCLAKSLGCLISFPVAGENTHRDLVVLKHGHEDPRKYPNDWDPIIHFDMKNSNGMCMLPPSVLLVKIMVMKGFTVLAATPKHRKITTLKSTLKSFN